MLNRRPLRIGLSARIYHPQAGATGIQSKSLQYLEQSVAHWVMSREVMVFMIPSVSGDGIVHRALFGRGGGSDGEGDEHGPRLIWVRLAPPRPLRRTE